MKVRRTRAFEAPTDDIWRIVRDPHHLPRWWPRAQRVEGVTGDAWTVVLGADRGRSVRADYSLVSSKDRRRSWRMDVEGTPFERIFASQVTTIVVEDGRVSLEIDQKSRHWARFGGVMLRRATVRMLDEALERLEDVV